MKRIIAMAVMFSSFGCSLKRDISLTAQNKDSHVVFTIQTTGIGSLVAFEVKEQDTNQIVWTLSFDRSDEAPILYGEVPAHARQDFPHDGNRPQALAPNKTYEIRIVGASAYSENSSGFLFIAKTDGVGAVISIVK